MSKTYMALWDNELGRYMHSGRNSTSLAEMKDALLGYFNGYIGDGGPEDLATASKMDAFELADIGNFTITSSNVPFDDDTEMEA